MTPWLNEYIGIPYLVGGRDHSGVDCYGLIRLVLNEKAGANMPLMEISPQSALPRQVRALSDGANELIAAGHTLKLETPKDFAIVLLRRGLIVDHCGLFF